MLNKKIPPPPVEEDEYKSLLFVERKPDDDKPTDFQMIYDELLKAGFGDTKVLSKGDGLLFNFKNDQLKLMFLNDKNLTNKFGKIYEYKSKNNLNEAILLGIDARFNSLLYMLNTSYDDEFIKCQIREKLNGVDGVSTSMRNKVAFLSLNYKKKTARITFVNEKKLAEAIGRGALTIGVSTYVLCIPIEKSLRTVKTAVN